MATYKSPLALHWFVLTKKFLLPLQIKMGKVVSKPGKVLKITGTVLLICISVISWLQASSFQLKSKSFVSCERESSDTIIMAHERFRGRVLFDVIKRMTLLAASLPDCYVYFQWTNHFEWKPFFVNAYLRNVFYIYAASAVP